jgi:acyl-CoA thioesterase-1
MWRNKFVAILSGAAAAWIASATVVSAAPLRIVAVGTSNTYGWFVSGQSAYPAVLQRLLKAKGVEAEVINAGVILDTTSRMLARIDTAAPKGTAIVILEPGPNDHGTKEERAANIEAIKHQLQARSVRVIVYDQKLPEQYRWDGVHFTVAGHALIAQSLLPRVMALVAHKPADGPATATTGQPPKPEADHQPAAAASSASHAEAAPPPSQTATAHPPK